MGSDVKNDVTPLEKDCVTIAYSFHPFVKGIKCIQNRGSLDEGGFNILKCYEISTVVVMIHCL